MRRALLVTLLAASGARADVADDVQAIRRGVPACDRTRAHCFGIQLHVAVDGRGPIVSPEWIAAQLAAANRHFARLDASFQLAGIDQQSNVHVETRGDRDGLAAYLGGPVVHVFITRRLDDVDVAGSIAFGVTWHAQKDPRKYIIVSAEAMSRTLAHELGHFFGLPHSTYAISIMNKTDRAAPPPEQRTFADEEIEAMRPVLEMLVREHVLAEQPR